MKLGRRQPAYLEIQDRNITANTAVSMMPRSISKSQAPSGGLYDYWANGTPSWSFPTLATGLTGNGTTGEITGSISTSGDHSNTVTLTVDGFSVSVTFNINVTSPPSGAPLLTQSNFTYLGGFRPPSGGASDYDTYSYGGRGLCYNPDNNSLYCCSHANEQWPGEFTIPAPSLDANIANWNTASHIQTPHNGLNQYMVGLGYISSTGVADHLYHIGFNHAGRHRIGGMGINGSDLIVGVYGNYDTSGQRDSHVIIHGRSNLSTATFSGPYRIHDASRGYSPITDCKISGGSQFPIPAEYQADLGGPWGATLTNHSIIEPGSFGPSFVAYDPADLVTGAEYPNFADGVVCRRGLGHGDSGQWNYSANSMGNGGGFIADGTRTFVALTMTCLDGSCYGTAAFCNDFTGSKGYHCLNGSYSGLVQLYDVNALVAVANGAAVNSPQPYEEFTFQWAATVNPHVGNSAVTWDATNKRIYCAQGSYGGLSTTRIQVWELDY